MSCKIEIPTVPGLNDGEITVGRELWLHCENLFPKNFDLERISVKTVIENKYAFKVFMAERRDLNSVDVKWTSYQVGNFKAQQIEVTDGNLSVDVGPLDFEVKSVIDKSSPPKQPFGPVGPLGVPVPLIIWLVFSVLLLAISISITSAVLKVRRKRRWLKEKENYAVRLSPIMQMYVDIRRLERQTKEAGLTSAASGLAQIFDSYLIRKFDWPVPFLKQRQIARLLKKEFRQNKSLVQQLISLRSELGQLKTQELTADKFKMLDKDLQSLLERVEKERLNDLA